MRSLGPGCFVCLLAVLLNSGEARREAVLEDASEADTLSSYVVFLQTRLHSEPPRQEVPAKHRLGAGNHSEDLPSREHGSNRAQLAASPVPDDLPGRSQQSQRGKPANGPSSMAQSKQSLNLTRAGNLDNKSVQSPTWGDYVKAWAALAAETTASVGDALGENSGDDSGNNTDDGQDETVGTSAAVGATIGVVVGATVGVN
mmetsp:Transcript_44233/g.82741  ORF Transcript_44233/g.82741 Transcript_44233/m.82741 type:complete len:201 (+) Transcript_44233:66-668(+)